MAFGILMFSCKTKKVKETEIPKETTEVNLNKEIDLNQIQGDFYITSIEGIPELSEVVPTIKIDEEGKIGGFNGCNSFFGQINKEGGPLLKNLGSTRRACQGTGSDVENMMMEVLASVTNIVVEPEFIKFYNNDKEVISGKRLSLEEGTWQVTSMVGTSSDQLPSFEINNNRMTGQTGCNSFFGMTQQNGFKVKFIEVGATEMACEGFDMTMESKFLKAMSSLTEFKLEGNQAIFSQNGKELFRAENPR